LSLQPIPPAPSTAGHPAAARITVADALALPVLRRGLPRVVAGDEHLGRAIRWVHAGEVPNIAKLLRGGELLLTTGMGIGARAADQRRFVAELAARDVAAVVIELGAPFRALPLAMVGAAREHGLPLVELRREVPFVGVTEAVHTAIVNEHYDLLRRADALQARFGTTVLHGGGIPDVLALLADAIGNPVFLESGDSRLLCHAAPRDGDAEGDPVGAWARAADAGVRVTVEAPPGTRPGRLVALPVDAPLDPFTEAAVERAAGVVALALLRGHEEGRLQARGRGALLAALAAGSVAPARAAEHARALGFAPRPGTALLPVVARLTGRACTGGWAAALPELERVLATFGVPVLAGVEPGGEALLLLVGLGDPADRRTVADRAATLIQAHAVHRHEAGAVVAVGPAGDWAAVHAALAETRDSAAAALALPPRPWHDATRMSLDQLLWRWRDRGELAAYVERVLGPLLAYDAARRTRLVPTLEALCHHGGRKAETARAMHLNRQALYDRIARLEQVLDVDTGDAHALLELQLAVQARRHLQPPAPAPAAAPTQAVG
jgi:purine catabolism regulator